MPWELRVCVKCMFNTCPCRGLKKEQTVLLTHGDSVDKVAKEFKIVAQSGKLIAGMLSVLIYLG